ncbi:hypothetical protein NE850_25930 [Paraburkholderia sp. USG1]|uniref:hypothetical protein n=1 Tax=Paraburkholderia sp. USG1 TaxID=2952268 RepID=UPI002857CE34|nr:hypothetical protein [Paraburkholderia sp. USG1]MDR8399751.1 hypothetical protein [Paraburkholderia sp. USG1]
MTRAVINWKEKVAAIELLYDLDDVNQLYYVPTAHWGQLIRQDLGTRATVLRGEIKFDLDASEQSDVSTALPGKRIAPIATDGISGIPRISIEISSPHTGRASLIPSLPYPTVAFNATIQHADSAYKDIIATIEEAWNKKALILGPITADVTTFEVFCSAEVLIDSRECWDALESDLTGKDLLPSDALSGVREVVNKMSTRWITNRDPHSGVMACADDVHHFLEQKVFDAFFRSAPPLAVFENGFSIEQVQLVERASLASVMRWRLSALNTKTSTLSLLV